MTGYDAESTPMPDSLSSPPSRIPLSALSTVTLSGIRRSARSATADRAREAERAQGPLDRAFDVRFQCPGEALVR
jgi:hypothetical protein